MSLDNKNFLAFDTSAALGAVTLFNHHEIFYEQSLPERYAHGQLLFDAIQKALLCVAEKNLSLDAIFVGLGPGSFVGLRIALAAALAFSFGRDLPLIGFCSHRALAFSSLSKKNIHICVKASGDLCYFTSFSPTKNYLLECQVLPKEQAITMFTANSLVLTNLELNTSEETIQILGPSAEGLKKACLYKLAELGKIIDESAYIKPNYVKAPSVSQPVQRII